MKPIKDYILTLDTAKQIAMLSRTEKGKQGQSILYSSRKAI